MESQQKILREETTWGEHFIKSSLTAGVAHAWRKVRLEGGNELERALFMPLVATKRDLQTTEMFWR